MKNQVQLITYVDRLGGPDLAALHALLKDELKGLFGGVHLLPFFYPIDGEDAGFDPIDHRQVDPRLGNWEGIQRLGQDFELMADLIVNHISADSDLFKDVLARGKASPYAGLFLSLDSVFPEGATEAALTSIYRPRPGLPFTTFQTADGQTRIMWTTFTGKQVDIDVHHPEGKKYLASILDTFAEAGVKMIRMDAVGYAIKTPGTSCFMTEETFAFIESLTLQARERGIEVLVEIHAYFRRQIEIAQKVDWVYDFALPPLVLHTLFSQSAKNLKKWLKISPRNAITVLDTHDGIGIIDIGAGSAAGEEEGLAEPNEIEALVEEIHARSQGQSRKATGAAASNLDLYQVNCTFFDALGRDEQLYLLARLIQYFSPGIPQVYYVGLFAGENDMELLEKTHVGRDINRHYFSKEEIRDCIQSPYLQQHFTLIRFRNTHPAFQGSFHLAETAEDVLMLQWKNEDHEASLAIDLSKTSFTLSFTEEGSLKKWHNSIPVQKEAFSFLG